MDFAKFTPTLADLPKLLPYLLIPVAFFSSVQIVKRLMLALMWPRSLTLRGWKSAVPLLLLAAATFHYFALSPWSQLNSRHVNWARVDVWFAAVFVLGLGLRRLLWFSAFPTTRIASEDFYRSRRWRRLRYAVLRKYGRACQCCGSTQQPLHVDHIKPRSKYPELQWEFRNLQVLCADCNLGKGAQWEDDWRRSSAR